MAQVAEERTLLSTEWHYTGTVGLPLTKDEGSEGRKILKNGAQRTHRILSEDELSQGKQARWLEMEVHGSIRVISKSILAMKHLTALFLNHNYLTTIPREISNLTHLSILDVSNNNLRSIPPEMGEMASLMHLNLSNNHLKSLPAELGKLFRIKTLNVSNNPLPQELLGYGHSPQGSKKLLQHLLDGLATNTKPPPARKWFKIPHPSIDKPVAEFTVFCYNVLCDKYATTNLYSYCPSWALNWEYRKNAIIKEILRYNADIVALQEVEAEQFKLLFEPNLKEHGYSGIFAPKSRAKTMNSDDRKHVDGCALFWKNKKFRMNHQHLVEFAQVAINKAYQSDAIINRVMPKDNIALMAIMEVLPGVYRAKDGPPPFIDNSMDTEDAATRADAEESVVGTPLVLCAAHIHWDPEFCDVKLIQSMMLVHECARQIEAVAEKHKIALPEVPLIICGDFNSLPDSGVFEYLTRGIIHKEHPDLKSFRNDMVLNGMNTNEYADLNYTHALQMESAISQEHVANTNITHDFKGMIDYIFTSPQSLNKVGYLGGVDQQWINENKILGFPHPHVPSDHIPIMAQYILLPQRHRQATPSLHRFRRRSESFTRDMEKARKA
ncbi:unnamed protein product [Bursaphelenchus okinawaensis]|uniref:poly(A)-specific ribonuclease n=1 Tax=Bursaphelenchus okinawaensis TaxID=465554 RepID=A0A811KYI2_9BILA|nr:unnamed protein product [Bursaphelenchus okinawaensis]CAG9113919.1 unnamed protein product [Bursaphelenchus okinawaensis]